MNLQPGISNWYDRRPTIERPGNVLAVATLTLNTILLYTVPANRSAFLSAIDLHIAFTAGAVGDLGRVSLTSDPSGGGFQEVVGMQANGASPTEALELSWMGHLLLVAGDFLTLRVDALGSAVTVTGDASLHLTEFQAI